MKFRHRSLLITTFVLAGVMIWSTPRGPVETVRAPILPAVSPSPQSFSGETLRVWVDELAPINNLPNTQIC